MVADGTSILVETEFAAPFKVNIDSELRTLQNYRQLSYVSVHAGATSGTAWSFIGWADGESTQRTQVDSGEIPPSATGRRRWPAPRVGGAVHRRGREWSAARFYFGEAPHRD